MNKKKINLFVAPKDGLKQKQVMPNESTKVALNPK